MSTEEIDELLRKIWITKKCRIEASERLGNKDGLFQKLSVYYSILIVGLSIWNFQIIDVDLQKKSSLIILIASIALSLFSMFVTSKNYRERYFNLKNNYIELGNLYAELNNYKNVSILDENKFLEIYRRYSDLLKYVENHSSYDYYRVIMGDEKEKSKLTKQNIDDLKSYSCKQGLITIAYIVLPLICMLVLGFIF